MNYSGDCDKIIQVQDRKIGRGQPIFLTAEIGLAHIGNFKYACEMIEAAAAAGCDGVDMFMGNSNGFYFAPFKPDKDTRKVWDEQSFSDDQWRELLALGRKLDIVVYATPLDLVSLGRAAALKVPMININSDDANNLPFLIEAAKLGVPITMHDISISLAEIDCAVSTLLENGAKDIILLHSTRENGDPATLYSTANLRVMDTYKSAFGARGVLAGCVEHTTSDFLIYGVAARQPALISKHIQLANSGNTHDASISVDTDSLSTMVKKVRYIEMALGSGSNQTVVDADGVSVDRTRSKVLVANRFIPAGTVIGHLDIVAKRPGRLGGLGPWYVNVLQGARAACDIPENTLVNLNMFKDFQEPPYKQPYPEKVEVKRTDTIRGA